MSHASSISDNGIRYNPAFKARALEKNRLRKEEQEKKERAKLARKSIEKSLSASKTKSTCIFKRTKYHQIEYRICNTLKINPDEIKSDSRNQKLVFARQAIMYWAIRLTLLSYPQVGQKMGDRDHTTILHGAKAYRVKRAKMGRHLREAR